MDGGSGIRGRPQDAGGSRLPAHGPPTRHRGHRRRPLPRRGSGRHAGRGRGGPRGEPAAQLEPMARLLPAAGGGELRRGHARGHHGHGRLGPLPGTRAKVRRSGAESAPAPACRASRWSHSAAPTRRIGKVRASATPGERTGGLKAFRALRPRLGQTCAASQPASAPRTGARSGIDASSGMAEPREHVARAHGDVARRVPGPAPGNARDVG